MSFKNEIKKAITQNTKYTAVKVWPVTTTGNPDFGDLTMFIEVSIRKKKRLSKKKTMKDFFRPRKKYPTIL